ncbi:MAG: hypothetical protein ACI8XZ_005367 [Gammaproteobacteria bacterium]|jgi:hypothetical protein
MHGVCAHLFRRIDNLELGRLATAAHCVPDGGRCVESSWQLEIIGGGPAPVGHAHVPVKMSDVHRFNLGLHGSSYSLRAVALIESLGSAQR